MIKLRKRRHRHQRNVERQRETLHFSIDSLEWRTMLTTTLFLDFGAGFAVGGLTTTAGDFRDVDGASTGTDMTDTIAAGDDMTLSRLAFDFDGVGGVGDVNDANALAAAVVPLVQRALEPYDINVVVNNATSLADVQAAFDLNNGDGTGEFDAYCFVTTVTSTVLVSAGNPTGSLGQASGLFGRAAVVDLGASIGNNTDEATLTFADNVLGSTNNAGGNFNQNLAQRLAYTATHEAFHTFSFRHTPDEASTNPPASAAERLLASGDVIRLGSVTRQNPFIVTRFDLMHDGPVPDPNHYLQLANDADIGLRDGNMNGTPDLAYITGTGAHDLIDIDANGASMVDVAVNAFFDQGMTNFIRGESYTIDLTSDADNQILVDGSINSDLIDVEGDILVGNFRIRGGQGLDSSAMETDLLRIDGGGNAGSLFLTGAGAGTLSVTGGAFFNFSEMEQLDLNNFGALSIIGDGGANNFELTQAGGGDFVVNVDGFAFNAEATSFDFSGQNGNDQLVIDNGAGIVNRLVGFSGAGAFDTLVIEGNPGAVVARETYLVGATQDAGTWILDPNGSAGVGAAGLLDGDELVVEFTGLDPVDTSTPAVNFDIFLTGGNDDVRFEAGGLLAGVASTRVVDVAGTFETFRYANKQQVTLDSLGGEDVITDTDGATAFGELSRTLMGNLGNDLFVLSRSDVTAAGGMGNDVYQILDNPGPVATITIEELLGEGSDTVDFSALASPAMATDQMGTGLAMGGNHLIEVAAAGQQKNIEFGINAAPYVAYTMAPAIGVPFMTMHYEVEYADVGTMSSHTSVYDWGDGNSDPGVVMGALGMGTATGSHQFDTVDMFNVIATITDDEGLSKSEVAMTTIQQFALLPDQKNPALTALYVGGTVGIDVLKFKQLNSGDVRAILNGETLGEFTFDGAIFAYSGSGNDVITPIGTIHKTLCFEGGGDVDVLRGSVGDDFLMGQSGKDTIIGRGGNDTIEGGSERDHLFGNGGDDTILAGLGNDVVKAGDGDDYVDGGSGNDVIFGAAGDDLLLGRGNDDRLVGGGGNDVMGGGSGLDNLSGGSGNDLLLGEASTHDADPMAWQAIRDEWLLSPAAIPVRVTNIMVGGGLNGATTLTSGVTVFDDGHNDILTSGGGTDWYLVFANDEARGVSGIDIVSIL